MVRFLFHLMRKKGSPIGHLNKKHLIILSFMKNLLLPILACLLFCACTHKPDVNSLPRSTPEAEGVSSEAILKFVDAVEKSDHELHSFIFLRHGKVIAEGWWNPYAPELKHTLYSLSKSFTSTAVGFAVTEKLLTLNDKVISFFPDQLPDTVSSYLSEMTVKDLLTMSAGQDPDPTYKIAGNSGDWVKTFLSTPVLNRPGTKFLYNSLATFMLSAIVQKVTGEKIIDYLKPRFFIPLGIEGIDWEVNSMGINTGGWGLRLKTEDIAKVGQFYLQKGIWNGIRLLPQEWIEEATTIKIEQAPHLTKAEKDASDWMQGYCYQFWRCRNNAYRGDGAFGQFMIVLPDQDAVIAITAETSNMQDELNLVWEYLFPAMRENKLPSDKEAVTMLRKKLSSLALNANQVKISSTLEKNNPGKTFVLEPNDKGIETISFNFINSMCHFTLKIDSTDYKISFAEGKWNTGETFLPGPNLVPNKILTGMLPFKITASYTWLDENKLELTLRYIETAHKEIIYCTFDKNKISISFKTILNQNRTAPEIKGEISE